MFDILEHRAARRTTRHRPLKALGAAPRSGFVQRALSDPANPWGTARGFRGSLGEDLPVTNLKYRSRTVLPFTVLLAHAGLVQSCGGGTTEIVEPPAGPVAPAISLRTIAGRWAGPTVELRTPNRYTTRITINDSTRLNELGGYTEYDGSGFNNPGIISCQSLLHTLSVAADTWSFRETVQSGQCTNNGRVVLQLVASGDLELSYYGPAGNLSATATLKRQP